MSDLDIERFVVLFKTESNSVFSETVCVTWSLSQLQVNQTSVMSFLTGAPESF